MFIETVIDCLYKAYNIGECLNKYLSRENFMFRLHVSANTVIETALARQLLLFLLSGFVAAAICYMQEKNYIGKGKNIRKERCDSEDIHTYQ